MYDKNITSGGTFTTYWALWLRATVYDTNIASGRTFTHFFDTMVEGTACA